MPEEGKDGDRVRTGRQSIHANPVTINGVTHGGTFMAKKNMRSRHSYLFLLIN